MDPAPGIHEVGKDANNAVRARWHLQRGLVHQEVGILLQELGLLQFELAEGITEPAHGQPAVKANAFQHPLTLNSMAERSQSAFWINQRPIHSQSLLPEGAAHDGKLPRLYLADT